MAVVLDVHARRRLGGPDLLNADAEVVVALRQRVGVDAAQNDVAVFDRGIQLELPKIPPLDLGDVLHADPCDVVSRRDLETDRALDGIALLELDATRTLALDAQPLAVGLTERDFDVLIHNVAP